MLELTFGEQVKVVLSRKGMTIKELAELIEERTGKKMSRQNLTQRLSRDNFQEQDMRMIAGILECPFYLSILEDKGAADRPVQTAAQTNRQQNRTFREEKRISEPPRERDITVGELLDIHRELDAIEEDASEPSYTVEELLAEVDALESETKEQRRAVRTENEEKPHGWKAYLQRNKRNDEPHEDTAGYEEAGYETMADEDADIFDSDYEADEDLYIAEETIMDDEENTEIGDVNPYTGREYKTNSVRMHPDRIGYVQVYDRAEHRWTDMTEWAFLGYQERKKALLGKDYEPPIYLD